VLGPAAVPVASADIDVDTSPGNVRIYTPHDSTNSSGQFTVVVPTDSYRVTVEPPFAQGLVGHQTAMVTVNTNTTIPTVNLQAGVVLSGTITAWNGAPERRADIDVIDPSTGEEVITPGDDTGPDGQYAVLVPTGNWQVRVQTRKASLSRVATLPGINVTGATTLNHRLSVVPVRCFLGTVGIPTVPQGEPVFAVLAFQNITASMRRSLVSLVLIDPTGGEALLREPFPVFMRPGSFGLALGPFGTASARQVRPLGSPGGAGPSDAVPELRPFHMPVFLPPVNPAFLGQPFRLKLRFDNPETGAEQDRDSFTFIRQ
jgi:hypothetical protein